MDESSDSKKETAKFVARQRAEAKLTRCQLARRLKVTTRTIRNWENGIYAPTPRHTRRLKRVIQRQIRAIEANGGVKPKQCGWCSRQITDAQYAYTRIHLKRPLCWKCQKKKRMQDRKALFHPVETIIRGT